MKCFERRIEAVVHCQLATADSNTAANVVFTEMLDATEAIIGSTASLARQRAMRQTILSAQKCQIRQRLWSTTITPQQRALRQTTWSAQRHQVRPRL